MRPPAPAKAGLCSAYALAKPAARNLIREGSPIRRSTREGDSEMSWTKTNGLILCTVVLLASLAVQGASAAAPTGTTYYMNTLAVCANAPFGGTWNAGTKTCTIPSTQGVKFGLGDSLIVPLGVTVDNYGVFDGTVNIVIRQGGTFNNYSVVALALSSSANQGTAGGEINNAGTFTNKATVRMNMNSRLFNWAGTVDNSGTIAIARYGTSGGNNPQLTNFGGIVTNTATGVIQLKCGRILNRDAGALIKNTGSILVQPQCGGTQFVNFAYAKIQNQASWWGNPGALGSITCQPGPVRTGGRWTGNAWPTC
jgi:hypothetical protein